MKKWLICKDGDCWDVSGSEMSERKVISKSEYFKIKKKIDGKFLLTAFLWFSIVLNIVFLGILLKIIL